jgi:hypothetical protein
MQLRALKPLRWPGRRLKEGDVFEVRSESEANVMRRLGLAEDHQPPVDEREPLRQRAAALGIDVDGRWGVARLEEEIAAAEQTAQSRRRQRPAQEAPAPEPPAAEEQPAEAPAAETAPEPEPQGEEHGGVSAITTEEAGVTPTEGHYQRRDMRVEDR